MLYSWFKWGICTHSGVTLVRNASGIGAQHSSICMSSPSRKRRWYFWQIQDQEQRFWSGKMHTLFNLWNKNILVFYCCCNELPQTDLKQYNVINLLFWSSEVWNPFYWVKIKALLNALGECCFFQPLEGTVILWFSPSSSVFKPVSCIFKSLTGLWPLTSDLLPCQVPCDHIGPR